MPQMRVGEDVSPSTEKKFPHYWGCLACFTDMGGVIPQGTVGTATLQTCRYCNGEKQREGEALFPWVDYDWSNDREATRLARSARD